MPSGRFAPGQSGNPAGRPPGIVSRVTAEMREFCRNVLTDPAYQQNVMARILAGEANHIETLVWFYALGKPKDILQVEGEAQSPVMIVLQGGRRDPMAEPEPERRVLPPVAEPAEVLLDLDDLGRGRPDK